LREKLQKGYVEQITSFIRKNIRGTAASKSNQSGGGSRGISSVPQPKSYNYIPLSTYFNFENMNLQGLSKKVIELNDGLKASGSASALTERDLKYFENIIAVLGNTSFYHSSKLSSFEEEVGMISL
jgi:hypothetical protein